MKRYLFLIIIFTITATVTTIAEGEHSFHQQSSQFAGGSGTEGNPYLVETAEHLDNVRNHLTSHFLQIADIELGVSPWNSGSGWTPIGTSFSNFRGSYDGNGYQITNLTIINPGSDNVGLFGYIGDSGAISNLQILAASIQASDRSNVGVLAGYARGEINGCSASGSVAGYNRTGGLLGRAFNEVRDSSFSGTVVGNGSVGGLIGIADIGADSFISYCYAVGTVIGTGSNYAGGLIGQAYTNSGIKYCFADVNVTGVSTVGGLISSTYDDCTVLGCYAKGDVTGSGSNVGGLVGAARADITGSIAVGEVKGGNESTGGLVGNLLPGYTVTGSYATGNVEGQGASPHGVGGLVGRAQGIIEDSHASGNIKGDYRVGGLAGSASGSILRGSATGTAQGRTQVGGLVGINFSGTTIEDCYAHGAAIGQESRIGGLVGLNSSSAISRCYAVGAVSGATDPGGLVGENNQGTVTASYYNQSTTGQSDTGKGNPISTTLLMQMTNPSPQIYTGWSYDVWSFQPFNMYPWLLGDPTLQQPFPVTLVSPRNMELIEGTSVTLTWNRVPRANEYIITFRRGGGSAYFIYVGSNSTSITREDLLNDGSVYTWSVKAVDKNREGLNSVTRTFINGTGYMAGDINGDGVIDVNDVIMAMQHVLGLTQLNENQQLAADVNADGTINIEDLVLIMRYILGLIQRFPVEE